MKAFLMTLSSLFVFSAHAFEQVAEHQKTWDEWTDVQIQQDFAPYEQTGITFEMLDQTMAWNSKWRNIAYAATNEGFVRYRIVDSQIYQTPFAIWLNQLGDAPLKVLEEMIKKHPVPDVDFIYFNQDGPVARLVAPDGSMPLGPIFSTSKRDGFDNIIMYHDFVTPSHLQPDPTVSSSALEITKYSWRNVINEVEDGVKDYPWHNKIPKLFWRGRDSDGYYSAANYRLSPRIQTVLLSGRHPELIDAAFTGVFWNQFLLDWLEFPPSKHVVDTQEHIKYKYQIVMDGISVSVPGYAWRLLSDSLVFKVKSPFKQWYEAGLTPGIHYLTIENDMSDLLDKIVWAQEHDEEAHVIAENGRQFAQKSIMPDDVLLYCFKVLKKQASLLRFTPQVPNVLESCQFKLVSSPLTDEERAIRRELLAKSKTLTGKSI